MSRAEKKLKKLKAKEELTKLKTEKRERQQQDFENAKKQWDGFSDRTKKTLKIIGGIFIFIVIIALFTPTETETNQNNEDASQSAQVVDEVSEPEPEPKSAQEKMLASINGLIDSGSAFDTGSYVKGDIPKGEYAFVTFDGSGQYYSEEDSAGNIIDNENFDSFGYVYVQGVGNIKSDGVLIKVSSFKKLVQD